LQKLSLVLGGAASGKSAFAERLLLGHAPRTYVATLEARDAEMERKVARHRALRGGGWKTVEAPLDAGEAVAGAEGAVLLDCATLWLTNQMLGGRDVAAEEERLLAALAGAAGPVVVVSNELGLGLVPETPLGRRFREAQGRLNQRLAEAADLVVFVAAGLPLVLKGKLP
jgi:adenosylcobinamide kinase/adenosylcobinamide-phosphate guanylyltransferase